jgi:hypothetical protein
MQYSTDLRVRYANADLNLALDGWHKNGEAAGLLIERPQTDLKYRPAAVYFLGMLAGRGVAYDKNSSCAARVRQKRFGSECAAARGGRDALSRHG